MKLTQTKTSILDPKPVEEGFIVGKYTDSSCYAAVPLGNSATKLMIIHEGKQLKICRNRKSAINFIKRHCKGKSVAKLPI